MIGNKEMLHDPKNGPVGFSVLSVIVSVVETFEFWHAQYSKGKALTGSLSCPNFE